MLKKLIREKNPQYLAVAFDHKAPTFRHQKFKDYKITRKPTPEPLKRQLPLVKEIVRGYNFASFEVPGYEADDLLAFIALEAKKRGLESYIVSSDKDILQVVQDGIYVYHPQKDLLLDQTRIEELYEIKPPLFPDLLALMGDQIDNIPGLPGVGEKTAKELVKNFGSLEEILENLDKLPSKLKEIISQNREKLLLSKELAKINSSIELNIDLEELKLREPNYQLLVPIFETLEFQSLIKEILQEIPALPRLDCQRIDSQDALSQLLEQVNSRLSFSFYLELQVENENKEIKALYIALDDKLFSIERDFLRENSGKINQIFQSRKIEKTTYGLKQEIKFLKREQIEVLSPAFDVEIAAYLIDPSREDYSLFKIALHYLEGGLEIASSLLKEKEGSQANSLLSCKVIESCLPALKSKLKELNLEGLYFQIEEPLIFVLSEMEERGIAIDKNYLEELSKEYEKKIERVSQEIYSLAGMSFNLNSPKQLREVLYGKLKLKPLKKGKTGPSTDETTLRSLSREHPIPNLILQHRELSKIKSTYIQGLLNSISPQDGKIHTTFNQTITQTGRLSCSNPNLQTIPIRSELGKQIRKAFVPSRKDYLLLSADYSQIELRILAHLSQDKRLIEAFKSGKDIHRHTAGLIFGVEESLVSEEMRSIAKTVNFGIIYGISSYGLSKQLNLPLQEASKFIKYYFQLYPGVRLYIEKIISKAREQGYVSTLFNRIRYLPEINSLDAKMREFGERLAINTTIQGTAADLIKKVMVDIEREVKKAERECYLLLQIHDELLFEIPRKNLSLLRALIVDKMENALALEVPLAVNIKIGSNWLDLQKDEEGGING